MLVCPQTAISDAAAYSILQFLWKFELLEGEFDPGQILLYRS